MKKVISLIMLMFIPFMASCAEFEEGKQYTKVSEKASTKPEVREYFSFYCPHCLKFEPFFAKVKKQLPEGVPFERNHVDFLRAASPKIQAMLSKAVVTAQQMGLEEKVVAAIFNYIQVQRAVITSEKDLRNIFVLQGADGEKFDKIFKSFSVNSKAKQMKKNQDYFSQKGALTGVPTIIINGKYRINNQELDRDNFEEDYHKLTKYLLALK
ncbi:thiol:disulfide interchange protein DsbA/DsbL [Thalassomonas sp. RHCl1]|uniref:thiol:disulfide interchange protein DsbA/DsbL n=1 Tax=Thalassomonas sp. RHCl1 TaxID=2995320 RepID=UPI00248CD713|nr:thiol:disulfide interchange protein DsbA/DsbL [Thalassomonas sp. RHCl1]